MLLKIEEQLGLTIVKINGFIKDSWSNSRLLENTLLNLIENLSNDIYLDMTEVKHISDSAIGAIMMASGIISKTHYKIYLCVSEGIVKNRLEQTIPKNLAQIIYKIPKDSIPIPSEVLLDLTEEFINTAFTTMFSINDKSFVPKNNALLNTNLLS